MAEAVVARRRRDYIAREFPCSICNKRGIYLVEKCGQWMVTPIIPFFNHGIGEPHYKLAGICGRTECFNMILLSDKFFFN